MEPMTARGIARRQCRGCARGRRPRRAASPASAPGRTNCASPAAPAHALGDGQRVQRRVHDARQQRAAARRPASCPCKTGTRPCLRSTRPSARCSTPQLSREGVCRARGRAGCVEGRVDRRAAALDVCAGCTCASARHQHRQPPRRREARTSPCASAASSQARRDAVARRPARQLRQRLRRQLFGAELDEKIDAVAHACRSRGRHACAERARTPPASGSPALRGWRSRPAPRRAPARARAGCSAGAR